MRTLLSKNMIKGCVIKTETPATFGLIFWASEYLYSRERQREKRARAPLRTRRNARWHSGRQTGSRGSTVTWRLWSRTEGGRGCGRGEREEGGKYTDMSKNWRNRLRELEL